LLFIEVDLFLRQLKEKSWARKTLLHEKLEVGRLCCGGTPACPVLAASSGM